MRGKVTFEIAGQEHALRFTANRLCQLEEEAGESVLNLCAKMDDPENIKFTDLRMIFRAGLVEEVSLSEAGNILDELGFQKGMMLSAKALNAAFADEGAKPAPAGKKTAGAA